MSKTTRTIDMRTATKEEILFFAKIATREELIQAAVANDPNGTWTDEASEAEGLWPMTRADLQDQIEAWANEEEEAAR